jgi:hypothetical protein
VKVVRHSWSLLAAAAKREELDSPVNISLGEPSHWLQVNVLLSRLDPSLKFIRFFLRQTTCYLKVLDKEISSRLHVYALSEPSFDISGFSFLPGRPSGFA